VRHVPRESFAALLEYIYRGHTRIVDSPAVRQGLAVLAKKFRLRELLAHIEGKAAIPGSIFLDMHMVWIAIPIEYAGGVDASAYGAVHLVVPSVQS
jgi:hypothetical protein